MADLRRRLRVVETAVEEIVAADQVDGRSEIQKWVSILRMMLRASAKIEQTPEAVVAIGRIRRTLAMLEPVEHEDNFAHCESACQGARYQLSWPNHPATWDDESYEGRIELAIRIDRSRNHPPPPVELAAASFGAPS